VQRLDDAPFRNADQDNRLLVRHQLVAGDRALHVDADQDVDGLAGIADGGREIRVQIDEADLDVVCENRQEWRIALWRAETGGLREELLRRGLRRERRE